MGPQAGGGRVTAMRRAAAAGIDVRADNGYVLLAPSLHASGRRYAWMEGRGLRQVTARELPERIHAVLAAGEREHGHEGVVRRLRRRLRAEVGQAPDLQRWQLTASIVDLIWRPVGKGQRSEADMKVCVALLLAGAEEDDVWAVFSHYPIGTAGKLAEEGPGYLERTLARAHAYLAKQNTEPITGRQAGQMNGPMFCQMLDELQRWVHAVDLAEYVPAEKQCVIGYRTREIDLAVASAVLDTLASYGKCEGPISLRQLRRKVNAGGLDTVNAPCTASRPGFWSVSSRTRRDDNPDCPAGVKARVYRLNPELRGDGARSWCVNGTPNTRTEPVMGVPSTHSAMLPIALIADTTPLTPPPRRSRLKLIAEREAQGGIFAALLQDRRLPTPAEGLAAGGRAHGPVCDRCAGRVLAAGCAGVARLAGADGHATLCGGLWRGWKNWNW